MVTIVCSPYKPEEARSLIERLLHLFMVHHEMGKAEAQVEALSHFERMRFEASNYNPQQLDLDLSEPFQTKDDFTEAIEQIGKLRDFTQKRWKIDPENCGFENDKFEAERAYHGLSELLWLLEDEKAYAPEEIEVEFKRSGPKVKIHHQRIIEICVKAYECGAGFIFNEAADRNSFDYKQHSKALNDMATLALSPLPTQSPAAIKRMVQRVTRGLPEPLFIDIEL